MLIPDKISIVCPNFNKGAFIAETIESVLANTFQHWELIIIDDGSTDNSLDIIEAYVKKDHRIECIRQSNQGGAAARNAGMEKANGAYLLFLDSDDLLSPQCLEKRLCLAKKHPTGIGWVFPLLPFQGKFADQSFIAPWIPPQDQFLERLIEHDITWTSMSPLWKTAAVVPEFRWNSLYPRLQDIEFHTHILLKGEPIFTFPEEEPDCYYRLDEQKLVIGSRFQYLEKWGTGCQLYVQEFWGKLPIELRPKLSRTILAFLSVAGHYHRIQHIDKKQLESLIKMGVEACPLKRQKLLLSTYGWLLTQLPMHLPGLNAIIKFCLR
ncbi:MAG: hypothetical protein RLZZ205_1427 [Bacteroidota bacterium]